MFDVMSQAKNAMESYTTKMKSISSNISSMNVNSYKRIDMSFQTVFNQQLSSGSSAFATGNEGGTNGIQLGGTVSISATTIDFSVGGDLPGKNLSLKVNNGDKFFIVSPDEGRSFFYVKSGDFMISENKIVTQNNMQLYGFGVQNNGTSTQQLVPIDLSNIPGIDEADKTRITWDTNGILRMSLDTETDEEGAKYGTSLPFQVALTSFKNTSGLLMSDGLTYYPTISSGPANEPVAPKAGEITPRTLEASNVDYPSEVVESLEIQRAIDAAMSVIRMANDTITAFINKMG